MTLLEEDISADVLTGRAASVDELLAEAFDVPTESLAEAVESAAGDEGWFEALTTLVVDALLVSDQVTIHVLIDRLTPVSMLEDQITGESFGRLVALLEIGLAAQDRLIVDPATLGVAPGTRLAEVLLQIDGNWGISNHQIGAQIGIDKTEVSRQCNRLKQDGLAVSRRAGKNTFWQLTSRGEEVARQLRAMQSPPPGEEVDDVLDISSSLEATDKEALAEGVAAVLLSLREEIARLAEKRQGRYLTPAAVDADAYNVIVAPGNHDAFPWCVSATVRRDPRTPRHDALAKFDVDAVTYGDFTPAAIAFGSHDKLGFRPMDPIAGSGAFIGGLGNLLSLGSFVAVVPSGDGGWKVLKAGNKRATSVHPTKTDATKAGRKIAKEQGLQYLLIEDHSKEASGPLRPGERRRSAQLGGGRNG